MNTTLRGACGECIGLIGLGLVGTALAQRLAAAGYALVGHDRDSARAAVLAPFGGDFVASARALTGRCQRVVLSVYDTAAVESVTEGAEGLLAAASPPRLIIDTSTGDPQRLAALGGRLAVRGIGFVEAPLAGSSAQIAAGEATMILGGDTQALLDADDLLQAIAAKRHVAGGPGMGARAKLAANLVLGLNRAALAEGLVFARAQGLDPEKFLALLRDSPAWSAAMDAKGGMMIEGRFTPPQSRIAQHRKDIMLMQAEAAMHGCALPLTMVHAALLDAAIAAGDGDLDNAAVIKQIQRM
jgi:3-hydroxyisobutyrate dehydrogenase-like beta-hydroxyacid dehydrogenase